MIPLVVFTLGVTMLYIPSSFSFTISPPSTINRIIRGDINNKNPTASSLKRIELHSSPITQQNTSQLHNDNRGRMSKQLLSFSSSLVTKRTFLTSVLFSTSMLVSYPKKSNALPGVTVAEFEKIVRDSAKSIKIVELSGPKSETAIVTLKDNTQFAIVDLYESSVDPRSPLKLLATCRLNNVQTKSVGMENALKSVSSGSRKKKVYMNQRIQVAAEKEREKAERLKEDEIERLKELEEIEEEDNMERLKKLEAIKKKEEIERLNKLEAIKKEEEIQRLKTAEVMKEE